MRNKVCAHAQFQVPTTTHVCAVHVRDMAARLGDVSCGLRCDGLLQQKGTGPMAFYRRVLDGARHLADRKKGWPEGNDGAHLSGLGVTRRSIGEAWL